MKDSTEDSPPTRRRGLRFVADTLSGRLALVFAFLVLPPTIVSLYLAYDSYTEQQARAKLQVRQFATLTATYENKFFEDVRGALHAVASEPQIRHRDDGGCDEVLERARNETPEFASIGFFDREGARICGSRGTFEDVSENDWFREVSGFRGFEISDYTLPENSYFPVIVAAQSVYGADYQFQGVLAASIRLYWLSALVREISLPKESVFFLIDSNGTILADQADFLDEGELIEPASGDSQSPRAASLDTLARAVGDDLAVAVLNRRLSDFQAEGVDGIERVFTSVALPHGDVTVLFGMPAFSTVGGFEKDLVNRVLGLAAIWFSGLGAAWLGTRHLVTRWISYLRGTARAYGRGSYSERFDFSYAPRELRELAEALALMAGRIEEREEELRRSLSQKDIFLREIHHRVKNNLQIVSSLLNIRGGSQRSSPEEALGEVKAHVRALALVHRHLYESEDVQRIDLQHFMTELCQSTFKVLASRRPELSLSLDLPSFSINTDRAVPMALLVTEALTNSIKHAFPGGRRGVISITFEASENGAGILTVSDDGVGLPESARADDGIGISLIRAFAQQIDGTLEIEGPPGTLLRVTMSEETEDEPEV